MLKNQLFFIGFRSKVVRGQPWTTGTKKGEEQKESICPPNSPSTRIETPLARPHSFASPRPLARTNETKRFPGWRFHKRTHPPNLQQCTVLPVLREKLSNLFLKLSHMGGWGGAQLGNRFVSFVRAYARSGCLVELDLNVCGPAFSLFPLVPG